MNCFDMSVYTHIQEKEIREFEDRFSTAAFAVISIYNNNAFKIAIVYDHDFTPIYSIAEENGGNNASEFEQASANLRSTQTLSGKATNIGSGTAIGGHLGHSIVILGDRNGHLTMGFNSKKNVKAHKNVGTITNSTKPNIALFMSDNKYWIGPRKMSTHPDSRMGHARDLPEVGVNSKYGSIGFNEKTGQLAILEGNALGSQFRLVTWENLLPPQNFNTSEDFFTQDGITEPLALTTPWFPTSHEPAYQEDKKRAVVVVCDNGNIVCSKMFPHVGFATFEIVKSSGEYQAPTTDIYWHHWATTYGCEQGDLYGIRHRITLDGKYVVTYAPTYYYGSGIRFSIIRVSDGKVLSHAINDSKYGYSLIPIRSSEFILVWSK